MYQRHNLLQDNSEQVIEDATKGKLKEHSKLIYSSVISILWLLTWWFWRALMEMWASKGLVRFVVGGHWYFKNLCRTHLEILFVSTK